MAYMKPGQPWLYDETTGDIVGVKDADGGDSFFVLTTRNPDGSVIVVGQDGQEYALSTTVPGTRLLLLGDSMTLNNHQSLPAASVTLSKTNGVVAVGMTGHALIDKQLISVQGFAANTFNVNRVEITRVDANNFTYPLAGADVGSTSGTTSSSTNPIVVLDWQKAEGPFQYMNAALNGALRLVNNSGIGGDTYAMIRARLETDVDPYDFDILDLHGGYNGLNLGRTPEDEWADCKYIIDRYANAGKLVMLSTVFPVGPGHAKQADTAFISSIMKLREYQLNYTRPNLIVVDGFLDAINPLSSPKGLAKSNMLGDTIHPTAKLARLWGERKATALTNYISPVDLRLGSNADNWSYNSSNLQVLDACWANSGGTIVSPGTGTAPANTKFDFAGTVTAATITAPARSDGFGYNLQADSVAFSNAASPRGVWTIPSGAVAVGDEVVCVCEVKITGGSNNVKAVYGQFRQNIGGTYNGYAYSGNNAASAADYGDSDDTYLIVTPPMTIVSGFGTLEFSAIVQAAAAGTITTIEWGTPRIYKNLFNSRS